MILGRETLKTIHVGAPWHAEIRVEKIRHHAGRHSMIAQDFLFEVSASWTGPNLHGQIVDPRGINVRDSACTRSHAAALKAADLAAALLRAGQVPNLPKLLPASDLGRPDGLQVHPQTR